MAGNMIVELKQARFFAYHGLYPEERKTGNWFVVDLAVMYEPADELLFGIDSTINYAGLYAIVKDQMNQPAGLLESLAAEIAAKIRSVFPQTKKIRISITKLHPPIEQFTGQVAVTWEKEY